MPTNVDDIIKRLPSGRRKKVETRAAQLIAEVMTRPQLRRAHQHTQMDVAKVLGLTQDSVSRLEQRADILISTLRKYVQAMGGDVSIVARFPNQPPIVLSGFADDEPRPTKPKGRRRAKAFA
jgi:transcriptional regulator with XRE-family HTH domain